MKKQPDFTKSAIREQLEGLLREMKVEEVATYGALATACNCEVVAVKGTLGRVRQHLLVSERMAFGTITGEGIKRLGSDDTVDSIDGTPGKIRRITKRGLSTLRAAEFDELAPDKKAKHNAGVAYLGAMNLMSAPAKQKKLREAAESEIDLKKTIELLR